MEYNDIDRRYCIWTPSGVVKARQDGGPELGERSWKVGEFWIGTEKQAVDFIIDRGMIWFRVMNFDAGDFDADGNYVAYRNWKADVAAGKRENRPYAWFIKRGDKLPVPRYAILTPRGFVWRPSFWEKYEEAQKGHCHWEPEFRTEIHEAALGHKEMCFRYMLENGIEDAAVVRVREKREVCSDYDDELLDAMSFWPPKEMPKLSKEEMTVRGAEFNAWKITKLFRLGEWGDLPLPDGVEEVRPAASNR